MHDSELTPERLRELLPDDWVLADEVKTRPGAPIDPNLIRITESRIMLPMAAYRAMGSPSMIYAAFKGCDMMLCRGKGWKVQRKNKTRFIQPRRLRPMLNKGDYPFERLPTYAAVNAIRVPGCLALRITAPMVIMTPTETVVI